MALFEIGINDRVDGRIAPVKRQSDVSHGYLMHTESIDNVDPILMWQKSLSLITIFLHPRSLYCIFINIKIYFFYIFLDLFPLLRLPLAFFNCRLILASLRSQVASVLHLRIFYLSHWHFYVSNLVKFYRLHLSFLI